MVVKWIALEIILQQWPWINYLNYLLINIYLFIYFCCLHTVLLVWLSVSKFEWDLIIIDGLLAGSIDETINADSILPEEFRCDPNTDCLWHTLLILVLSNIRCHKVSIMIFITWLRSKSKSLMLVVDGLLSIWQHCLSPSGVFSREYWIRFPTIL